MGPSSLLEPYLFIYVFTFCPVLLSHLLYYCSCFFFLFTSTNKQQDVSLRTIPCKSWASLAAGDSPLWLALFTHLQAPDKTRLWAVNKLPHAAVCSVPAWLPLLPRYREAFFMLLSVQPFHDFHMFTLFHIFQPWIHSYINTHRILRKSSNSSHIFLHKYILNVSDLYSPHPS